MTEDMDALQERIVHLEAENADLRIRLETAEEESLDWKEKAQIDSMTGLPNRRAFDYQLELCATDDTTLGEQFALLFVDLRGLKKINHEHSPAVADNVLRHLARKLRMALRSDDHVLLARIGGDEFAILIRTQGLDLEGLTIIAKRIYMIVCSEDYCRRDNNELIPIQISIGGCLRTLPVMDAEEFFRVASENNEQAKEVYYQGHDQDGEFPIIISS